MKKSDFGLPRLFLQSQKGKYTVDPAAVLILFNNLAAHKPLDFELKREGRS
jgi:hypothetical protein